ncbi:hypothetical protein [Pajaroellobacter abortibovis]|uniref:hypothetical protein n=1 Tax=Pajaroellobacter abortibovis TaxID=1882918 RepID=UPI0012EBF1D2|nr:hypothetical protein [Pajaroellobacter abortibovis]
MSTCTERDDFVEGEMLSIGVDQGKRERLLGEQVDLINDEEGGDLAVNIWMREGG